MLESLEKDEPTTNERRSPIVRNVMSHIQALTTRAIHDTHSTNGKAPFEFAWVRDSIAIPN